MTGVVLARHRHRRDARASRPTACSSRSATTRTPALFKGMLDMDEAGYLITQRRLDRDQHRGVFAAGDVVDHIYRQAVTAAGMGCMAALDAERWLVPARPARRRGRPDPRQPESSSKRRR